MRQVTIPLRPSLNDILRPQVTETLLADVTRRIVQAFAPRQVILFGSYAYGTPHNNSDVDLFIIMDSEHTPHQRIMEVTEVAQVPFLPMDIIVRTPQEVAARLAIGDFFVREILERGRVLYRYDAA